MNYLIVGENGDKGIGTREGAIYRLKRESILSIVREDQVLVSLDTIKSYVQGNFDPQYDADGCACASMLYRWLAELEGGG